MSYFYGEGNEFYLDYKTIYIHYPKCDEKDKF